MAQKNTWENEYKNQRLITGSDKPQKAFLKYLKFLKKERNLKIEGLNVLDLGSGVGKNSIYLAELGANVTGLDISPTAIRTAKERAKENNLNIDFRESNIGSKLPFTDESFNLILDIMTSNSLSGPEREIYLKEVKRVLKTSGNFFVRTLKLEGDKNAKNLLKTSPGKETGTYFIKDLGLTEKVFSRDELEKTYSKYFKILKIEDHTGYAKFGNKNYKRNYWITYLENK